MGGALVRVVAEEITESTATAGAGRPPVEEEA